MTFRNKLTATITASLLTTALAACSNSSPEAGRPDATAPPTASSTPPATSSTPTASPTAAPERPSSANGLTLAAAEEFVQYYSSLLNYASDTGDAVPLLGESDAGCENCKAYADFVKKSNAANGLLKGDYREKVDDVAELVRGATGRLGGSATVQVGQYVSRQTPSATPFTSKPAKYRREFALSAREQRWVMFEWKQVKQ